MKKILIILILFFNSTLFAQPNPSVQFTVVPLWGDSFTPLSGIVHNVSPLNAYGIAVYIFVEEAGGWWTKPYASAPVTNIQPDSTFTTVIVTGGIDQYATRIIAFLIPLTYQRPIDLGQNLQDTLLNTFPYDVTCRPHGSRVINWSGFNWVIETSVGSPLLRIGPDNNLFSDQDTMVFMDSQNRLHLRIAKNCTDWYCSELIRTTSSGYNNYEVEIASHVDLLDPNIVAGFFTWDDCSPFTKPADSNHREIDIEFSKWRNPSNPDNSQFVVQPYYHPGNIDRFNIDLTGINYSDHNFTWALDTVCFHSSWGSDSYSWTRTGAGVPVPGNENFRINFYLDSVPPTNNQPAELILNSFTINSGLPAGVTIAVSSNPFCLGSLVTFTATPVNGGASPAYQWKVNGANVGINSSTYSYYPNNGDSIRCVMTSNLGCVVDNPISSSDIIMSGTLTPFISFAACFDTITTLNAQPIRLKGGIPLGGTYSGPGVNPLTGIFTPSVAGTGTKTMTYTYTYTSMCSASKSIHIIVDPEPSFSCGNNLTDIRDNKVYPTIQIGSQCWMASNLNYGSEMVSTQDQRDNCVWEKYCYNDTPTNCTTLGGLYQWDEVMQYDDTPADQGFCPPGWHIPTENDWNILFATYTNNAFAGSPLKFSGYSGFTAVLSGENYFNESWDYKGFATFFWSSTLHSPKQAWAHGMNEPDPSVSAYPSSKASAFSVRCIQD